MMATTVPKVVTGEDCRYVKLNLIYNKLTVKTVFTWNCKITFIIKLCIIYKNMSLVEK